MSSDDAPVVHKEDLSRMEGAYGAQMIGKLKQMDVLLVGMNGLGIETAKNLVLAGPHSVTVHDDEPVVIADLGANFYLKESDVGKPRAECVLPHLKEMNPNVTVNIHSGAITEDVLRHYSVVCYMDRTPLADLIKANDFCRAHNIVFLYGAINGAAASLFADFGPKFHVFDPDGTPERTLIIDHISSAKNGVVEIDGDRHLLSTGDVIRIEGVLGMSDEVKSSEEQTFQSSDVITDINQLQVITEYKNNPKKFLIGDTTKLGEYKSGGLATTVKQGLCVHHLSLKDALVQAPIIEGYMDFTKFGRAEQLHFARLALFEFQAAHGRFPALHSEDDAKTMQGLAESILKRHQESAESKQKAMTVDAIEADVVRFVSLYHATELTALAALFGGVLAQEITKQTGKFTPMSQWFHFDAFELLDAKVPEDAKPVGSRYDHSISIFGQAFQDKVQKQNVFMVGCGALGCEYLKAIAMMGLGTKGGSVHITDDDRIELSNLSRQFLFRRKHVGKPKSLSSAQAALEMNPALGPVLKAHEIRVEKKTEDVFDDKFWDSLDFVLNALDNNIARLYTDGKCVLHLKPLFESGTLGTQANSVVCLPFKTPSYSEGAVAGENQGIAQCTLRNFPHLDIHCIEWAKEKFDDIFVSGPDALNAFLEDREAFYDKLEQAKLEARGRLELVQKWLELSKAPSFELCMQLMFERFTTFFRDDILTLTHNFPKDSRVIDKDTGADMGPFWHGHKRYPQPAIFDPNNDLHLEYIYAGANILASVFHLHPVEDREKVRLMAHHLKAPEYKFSGATVDLSEGKKEAVEEKLNDDDNVVIEQLKAELTKIDAAAFKRLAAADFEKDDDTNHHIDFITASTNLRSFNYEIKDSTRQHCRMVAGRIIPAIATTTAMITGFIQIEVLKYIKGAVLESFRAATCNLGTNVYTIELLPDPIKKKSGFDQATYMPFVAVPEGFTNWDKIAIKSPDATLEELCQQFTEKCEGAKITTLASVEGKVLFADYWPKDQLQAVLKSKVMDVYSKVETAPLPSQSSIILIAAGAEDKDGESAITPKIQYYFK